MPRMEDDLRRFIIDNFLYGQERCFSNEDSFLDMGIIDSTGMLELVGFIEQQYGIVIEDRELVPNNLDSVSRLADFVDRKTRMSELNGRRSIEVQSATNS